MPHNLENAERRTQNAERVQRSASNKNLTKAKKAKNDEFYTQYHDIEKEIQAYLDFNPDVFKDKTVLLPCDDPEWSNFTKYFAQNFERFGLKKLISTSYAAESKKLSIPYQPSLFEIESPQFDKKKTAVKGKIFILDRTHNNQKLDINALQWHYLKGDGDFRSAEVTALRDEADFIITNPPFSLFREFLAWIMDGRKKCVIIGNMNAITYKETFKYIQNNELWIGTTPITGSRWFEVKGEFENKFMEIIDGKKMVPIKAIWFTNIDHGKRHQPLSLMTMEENLKFSRHKEIRQNGYQKYDNYDAIEVPFTDAIPSDYTGVMGVPISFLDKYCPEQFEIVAFRKGADGKDLVYSFTEERERERERETAYRRTAILPHTHQTSLDTLPLTANAPTSMAKESMQEFSFATSIPGLIKNAEGKIQGRITYARITIRKHLS